MSQSNFSSQFFRIPAAILTIWVLCAFSDTAGILPQIKQWSMTAWVHLQESTTLPNWQIYLLLMIVSLSVIKILISLLRRKFPKVSAYKQDTFLGINWRWSYQRSKPVDPWCFCPTCNTELIYSYTGTRVDQETELFCEKCNVVKLRQDGDKNYLINNILRQIKGNIRNEEWRNHI